MIGFSGHLRLRAERRGNGRSVLADQSFRAPFHLSKPYWDFDARTLVVQVVNPTAGILGGDELRSEIEVDEGASVVVTTPSASRVFTTTMERNATCLQRYSVAAGAWLEVAPEPLVPHRGSRFHQSTVIDVANGGGLLFLDQLLPGRIAHGETWSWDQLRLDVTVAVAGELVLRERLVQNGESLRRLARRFGTGDTSCFANAVFIPPWRHDGGVARTNERQDQVGRPQRDEGVAAPAVTETRWLDAVRALHRDGVWVGISRLRQQGYTIKIVAPNPLQLRDTLAAIRVALATVAPALSCRVRKQ